jgi:hypothetical protein
MVGKFKAKKLLKENNVKVDIKKLTAERKPIKDTARYYKQNYITEKRQLFFGK